MKKKVAILGGGIGGLSAAHELIERGFDVSIYECRQIPGGKARSFEFRPDDLPQNWPRGLPSEHGFRFFPGFYRHIIDTMERIDDFDFQQKVADNLVPATEIGLAAYDHKLLTLPASLTPTLTGVLDFLQQYKQALTPLLTDDDLSCYAGKIWQILTSCEQRRIAEYEKIGWKQFIDADNPARSPNYFKYFGKLARSLVAADPEKGSAKTLGDITVQLYLDISRQDTHFDRVLNGPTNEVFIHPWLKHLLNKGCHYYLNTSVESIHCENGEINAVTIAEETRWQQTKNCPLQCGTDACNYPENCRNQAIKVLDCNRYDVTHYEPLFPDPSVEKKLQIEADYYISAMPVEVTAKLLNDDLLKADPSLKNISTLAKDTAWMNGLLFYLTRDLPVVNGHTVYIDPPWALTSISQLQFWKDEINLADYGAGDVKGILSVDISDWENQARPAYDLTREQVIEESWEYVKRCLNTDQTRIHEDYLYAALDPAIEQILNLRQQILTLRQNQKPNSNQQSENLKQLQNDYQQKLDNLEPLLVNKINTWELRPTAQTNISNFMLASDYVKTNTDLASMEAANEAARLAVNAILKHSNSKAKKCKTWKTQEPWILAPYRWIDKLRFNKGLPWKQHFPFYIRIFVYIWHKLLTIASGLRAHFSPSNNKS